MAITSSCEPEERCDLLIYVPEYSSFAYRCVLRKGHWYRDRTHHEVNVEEE